MGENGAQGLALLESEKPNLLVLDLEMPVKDGLVVLHDMKKERGKPPYVLVLSSREGAEDMGRSRLGAEHDRQTV